MLAKQYMSMYPTLEIDVDGELAKLEVKTSDAVAPRSRGADVCWLAFRNTPRRSSPW